VELIISIFPYLSAPAISHHDQLKGVYLAQNLSD
jgi:hypothetical protein